MLVWLLPQPWISILVVPRILHAYQFLERQVNFSSLLMRLATV